MSAKSREEMPKDDQKELKSMGEKVKQSTYGGGVCVLFLIGLNHPEMFESTIVQGIDGSSSSLNKSDNILCVRVVVPADDMFGLANVITHTTMEGSEIAEVYSSHGTLHPLASEVRQPLRSAARKHTRDFYSGMATALKNMTSEESSSQ